MINARPGWGIAARRLRPPAPLEGVESAPKLLGEDEPPGAVGYVGESVWGQEGQTRIASDVAV